MTSRTLFYSAILSTAMLLLQAHKKPMGIGKSPIKNVLNKMQLILGGTHRTGTLIGVFLTEKDTTALIGSTGFDVEIESFYLSATEVTNAEWNLFYHDKVKELGKLEAKAKYYPDTASWGREMTYSYYEYFTTNYSNSSEYDAYPVIGVSWEQAQDYCSWLTKKTKEVLKEKNLNIEFRLASEFEWEYAARGCSSHSSEAVNGCINQYGWADQKEWYEDGIVANFGWITESNGITLKQNPMDGHFYTAPVASYSANKNGLYDMSGNVSEWVQDRGSIYVRETTNSDTINRLYSSTEVNAEVEKLKSTNTLEYNKMLAFHYDVMIQGGELLSASDTKL